MTSTPNASDPMKSHFNKEFHEPTDDMNGSAEESFIVDSAFEKKLLRKIDLITVPPMVLFYFLSFLDRTNIGNARIQGLSKDLALTDWTYRMALTIVYIPYILFELPSNLILKKIGPHIVLPALVAIWGLASTLQGVVTNVGGLYACRFVLGLAEAGLLPGIVLYLSTWYKREEFQTRLGFFWAAASLAGAFGGLLAAAISNLRGRAGLDGWCWIFIIEGIITTLIGCAGYFFTTRSASTSRLLSESQRLYQMARLDHAEKHSNDVVVENEIHQIDTDNTFSWAIIRSTFADPALWALSVLAFMSGCNIYTMAYFLPTIVAGLKGIATTPAITQLLTVPPYAIAVMTTITGCIVSDRWNFRYPQLVVPGIFGIIGMAILYSTSSITARYVAIHLAVPAVYTPVPAYLAFASSNFSGYYRRATSIGMVLAVSNCGSLLSVWLFRASEAPHYRTAYQVNLIFLCLFVALATVIEWHYRRQNSIREKLIQEGRMAEYGEGRTGDRHILFKYVV